MPFPRFPTLAPFPLLAANILTNRLLCLRLRSCFVADQSDRGDKLVLDAVAGVWNNKKVKVSKGMLLKMLSTYRSDILWTCFPTSAPLSPAGLAFPTCISINNTVPFPLPSDKDVPTLKDGDVVKVMLGVHIDGVSAAIWERVSLG